jgi:tRNA G18 (ribose-2'-O)-methylase SpoU
LRKKQSKFFDRYDADEMCSAESLLQLEVDEGAEASPEHMVDAIKKCLELVYLEAHEHEAPMWKQVAEIMERNESASTQDATVAECELVNFQRKIIPLDSLELDLEASRDARLKNALGRKKQQLVVCASLVDKVPNLAGLARTSEIFAAERLVIPDTTVCRMDNFKNVSVGAGDWIEIEGCKEDVSVVCILGTLVQTTHFAFLAG